MSSILYLNLEKNVEILLPDGRMKHNRFSLLIVAMHKKGVREKYDTAK